MQKTGLRMLAAVQVCICMMLFVEAAEESSKAFTNPLNSRTIDAFFIVDETNTYVNSMTHGIIKTTLNKLASDLNPASSSPYFGVYFYGATANVDTVVAFPTTTAAAVKSRLDYKQYTMSQGSRSTLTTALNTVANACYSNCRSNFPRVVVIISANLDSLAEGTIRSLERDYGMTVIVVGVGSTTTTALINRLATHPAFVYGIAVPDYFVLAAAAEHISDVASSVPRILPSLSLQSMGILSNGIYYTVQINTAPYTMNSEAIVMFASGCSNCAIYASLSAPNPTASNGIQNSDRRPFPSTTTGYPNTRTYFRVPRNAAKLYISILGYYTGSTVYMYSDVQYVPALMNF